MNGLPDSAEEVRHDEREYDCLLEERLCRLQPRDVLPPHARVVADDLTRDLCYFSCLLIAVQGVNSGWKKPPVDLDLVCSTILLGQ